jgi:fumarylacetoacetase
VGDLMGSGTVSGPSEDTLDKGVGTFGSLLELTWNGKSPLQLDNGESRTFIEDGDELTLLGWCQGEGYRVGFGTCTGVIEPAHPVDVEEQE